MQGSSRPTSPPNTMSSHKTRAAETYTYGMHLAYDRKVIIALAIQNLRVAMLADTPVVEECHYFVER